MKRRFQHKISAERNAVRFEADIHLSVLNDILYRMAISEIFPYRVEVIMDNPEFKRNAVLFTSFTVVLTVVGFIINTSCGIFTFVVCLIFAVFSVILFAQRNRKIKNLTESIDRVLHGNRSFKINDNNEGEFSILENEIQKMVVALKSQADELEKEKLYLSDSIADISHQLRTPLTSINLVITLFQSPDLTSERRAELLAQLTRLTRKIDRLVTVLLKISKIDAGTVKFEQKQVSIAQIIEKAAEPLAVLLDVRGQTLITKIEDEAYIGDFAWTVEAIGNILKNCSEHTPSGGTITVSADETPVFTQITITDSGNGFDKEDLPHLFERFYKGKNSSSESFGIGLALAKGIIIGQNGTIKADNCFEGGARFTIKFYKKQFGI